MHLCRREVAMIGICDGMKPSWQFIFFALSVTIPRSTTRADAGKHGWLLHHDYQTPDLITNCSAPRYRLVSDDYEGLPRASRNDAVCSGDAESWAGDLDVTILTVHLRSGRSCSDGGTGDC